MYAACETFIQVVGRDGSARVLAGTPGIGGCTDGPAAKATFAGARDLAMDKSGAIYVVDEINQVLRKLQKKSGAWHVTTVAGVPGERGRRHDERAPNDSTGLTIKGKLRIHVRRYSSIASLRLHADAVAHHNQHTYNLHCRNLRNRRLVKALTATPTPRQIPTSPK
jgi:hypothetical protein